MPLKERPQFPTVKKLIISKPGSTRIYKKTLDRSVDELAARLKRRNLEGSCFVDLHDDEAKYTLDLKGGEAKVTKGEGRADLTLRTDKATWVEMATGRLSPIDAFLMGQMEIHGDISFGKRLYAIAAKGDIEDLNI